MRNPIHMTVIRFIAEEGCEAFYYTAICDDGSMWERYSLPGVEDEWYSLPGIPQGDEEAKA